MKEFQVIEFIKEALAESVEAEERRNKTIKARGDTLVHDRQLDRQLVAAALQARVHPCVNDEATFVEPRPQAKTEREHRRNVYSRSETRHCRWRWD